MDGAHDLGGMHGFAAIDRSQADHFPNEWEKKVFQLTLACGMQGKWNLDQSRFARESMEPAHYLSSSYYEHWLYGLEVLLVEQGILDSKELETGVADRAGEYKPVAAEQVPILLERGGSTLLESTTKPQYEVGQAIRIVNRHPKGHTRMPRYIRGRTGQIILYHGAHIFPDQHALDGTKVPAHLYTVRFSAEELWGEDCAELNSSVSVDVFEPYVEGLA